MLALLEPVLSCGRAVTLAAPTAFSSTGDEERMSESPII